MRDSCGKSASRETPQAQAEEARGPPAESECLDRKSTSKLYKPKKNCGKLDFFEFVYSLRDLRLEGPFSILAFINSRKPLSVIKINGKKAYPFIFNRYPSISCLLFNITISFSGSLF